MKLRIVEDPEHTPEARSDTINYNLHGSSEAGIAAAYVRPNGQTDGFLPNKDELYLLYLQRLVAGGFSDDSYWSSSMSTFSITAWDLPFSAGIRLRDYWDAILRVRAVRAF